MDDKLSIRKLRKDDLDALYRIREIAFLDPISRVNPAAQAQHQAMLPYRYGRFRGDALLSSASWYPFSAYIGGQAQVVGALASVVSAAATRGQGHVRALLAHGLKMLQADGVGWSLEHPFDTRYYRKFGWETVSNGLFVQVPIARFARFKRPEDVQRFDAPDEAAMAHLKRVYRRWASAYNFTLTRDQRVRDDWQLMLHGAPWETVKHPKFIFAFPHAYAIVIIDDSKESTRLVLTDYAYETPQGREDIFGFVNHFAGQADCVRIQLPQDDPLCAEWASFSVAHPHPLQARIVDVAQALSGWQSRADVAFRVAVRDDFCPWNDATFQVDTHAGITRAARVDAPEDIAVDVRALAQILSGSVSASAARRTGLLRGDLAAMDKLCGLNSNPCFMALADYF